MAYIDEIIAEKRKREREIERSKRAQEAAQVYAYFHPDDDRPSRTYKSLTEAQHDLRDRLGVGCIRAVRTDQLEEKEALLEAKRDEKGRVEIKRSEHAREILQKEQVDKERGQQRRDLEKEEKEPLNVKPQDSLSVEPPMHRTADRERAQALEASRKLQDEAIRSLFDSHKKEEPEKQQENQQLIQQIKDKEQERGR